MPPRLSSALLAVTLLSFLPPVHSAIALDPDVFGRYLGFMRAAGSNPYSSAFNLRFTPTLRLSASYRIRRIPVREAYRFSPTGTFIGTARARGRLLATYSGTWSSSQRVIRANGTTRFQNGRTSHFAARIRFGTGTIQTVTRSGAGVVRASGVKA